MAINATQSLNRKGFAVEEFSTGPKVHLYKLESMKDNGEFKPTWIKVGPFPQAMVRELIAKGFRYNIPEPSQVEEAKVEESTELYKCEICNKTFKARIGLIGHQRTHQKE